MSKELFPINSEKLLSLIKQYKNITEFANDCGVGSTTIYRILKDRPCKASIYVIGRIYDKTNVDISISHIYDGFGYNESISKDDLDHIIDICRNNNVSLNFEFENGVSTFSLSASKKINTKHICDLHAEDVYIIDIERFKSDPTSDILYVINRLLSVCNSIK